MANKGPQNKTGVWHINRFTGGLSDGSKTGIPGSFRAGVGLDYRTDPDLLTANKKLSKDSGSTIDAVLKWIIDQGTNIFIYANNGKIFKRTSGGTYSTITTVSDSHANGMAVFDDYVYYASDKGLHRYGLLSGTPAVSSDFLVSVDNEIDQQSGLTAANTYTLTTGVNEGATHKRSFTPTVSNIAGIAVILTAKGTGNWTFTVHDASNNLIVAKTIDNADLPQAGSIFRVLFGGVYDITAAATYHFHIHSTVADGTVQVNTASDLSTAEYCTLVEFTEEDVDQESNPVYELYNGSQPITTINESTTYRCSFVPDRSNITGIAIIINNPGTTADWTVTLHDDQDTSLGSVSIAHASLKYRGGYQKFKFSSRIDVVVGATYHFHVTVSNTTGTPSLFSSTASDISTLYFRTYYDILENDELWHPMMFFPGAGALAIGNGNYLAIYDGITYRDSGPNTGSEKLKFPDEEKVRCLEVMGDHLVIGTWRGDGVNIHGQSRIYFWDGVAPSYTAFKDLTGEVHAIKYGQDGLLRIWHGHGLLSIFDGGLTLVKEISNIGENKYVEVYPGAVTNWNGLTFFGISDGNSTSSIRGVYSYGQKTKNYSMSLNFDYPISTGTVGANAQITALLGLGPDKFYVGWADNSTYGLDLITTTSDQASVTYETLVFDADFPYFEKKSSAVKLTFPALASGQTITVKYKLNRDPASAGWVTLGSASYASDGAIYSKSFAFDLRWKELELQITLATSGTDAPKLSTISTFFEIISDVQEL